MRKLGWFAVRLYFGLIIAGAIMSIIAGIGRVLAAMFGG